MPREDTIVSCEKQMCHAHLLPPVRLLRVLHTGKLESTLHSLATPKRHTRVYTHRDLMGDQPLWQRWASHSALQYAGDYPDASRQS